MLHCIDGTLQLPSNDHIIMITVITIIIKSYQQITRVQLISQYPVGDECVKGKSVPQYYPFGREAVHL